MEDTASESLVRRSRLKEWVCRYGPSELLGTATALGGYALGHYLTGSDIAAAYAGAMGENVGFYGTMAVREAVHDSKAARESRRRYGVLDMLSTGVKLVLEFGLGELLDTSLIRPLAMGVGARILGEEAGVLAGKFSADFLFYIPTILSYELRQHLTSPRRTE